MAQKKTKSLDKKKILIAVAAILVLALGISVAILAGPLSTLKEGRIHAGIFLGPVDVSDLTETEAEQKVLDYITEYEKGTIGFKISQNEKDYSANELKIEWTDKEAIKEAMDVGRAGSIFERYGAIKDLEKETKTIPLKLSYDKDAIDTMLKDMAEKYNEEAVDATIKRVDGKFQIHEGQEGIVLDEEKSREEIDKYFTERWNIEDRKVELVAMIQQPKGSVEELAKVKDLLGSFSTVCGSGERVINIKNGASRINGSVVYPGEVFSANAPMEPYTAAAGYVLGGTYENGQSVQSYGGGICQVSTTLYNAALFAELEIVQRDNHSMMVGYVQPSMDAAIAGTWKDLKFRNNTNAPIYIEGGTSGGKIFFNIYGQETRDPGRKLSFVSETLSVTEPEVQIRENANQPVGYFTNVGEAHTGMKAKLWKIVTENGKETSRTEVNSSSYQMTPSVYEVGTGGASESQLAAIRAGIEAKSPEQVQAAASAAAAPAEPPKEPEKPSTTPSSQAQP
ncbi:MAG: hypothetical protein E7241_04815 [Lachnospiraceae bacterium]|nr:hypothetical protein [Lachnospiraceae bacterium]